MTYLELVDPVAGRSEFQTQSLHLAFDEILRQRSLKSRPLDARHVGRHEARQNALNSDAKRSIFQRQVFTKFVYKCLTFGQ